MVSVAAGTFANAVDVANRACQHMGARQIANFAEDTVQAYEIAFNYDKLRRAELRRNVWRFSIRTVILRPVSATSAVPTFGVWDATKTYLKGSIVTYSGQTYQAMAAIAINVQPDQNPASWTIFYGQLMASLWAAGTYQAGEIVYTQTGSAQPVAFVSLANANADDPTAAVPAYDPAVSYNKGQSVLYAAVVYQSTTDFNVNQTPTGVAPWVTQPATQPDEMQGLHWLKLGAASLAAVQLLYPIGVGVSEQSNTLNVYLLPNGYLREAPQDPKGGSSSILGAPSGDTYRDWTYADQYFTTRAVEPIRFRFGADIADVTQMDNMFCELLAARIGMECVERVTQSSEKLQAIEQVYKKFGDEARHVNGIETGSDEPAEDDYITCRR